MANLGERRASKPSVPPMALGTVVAGRFELLGILGEGGTGVVYDAIRLADQKPVALKIIHPHLAGDQQVRGRFAREATILGRLTGSHLCPVLESGEVSDPRREGLSLLYLALPRLEGTALDAFVQREGPLPIERAVGIVLEICVALRTAHGHGIIHRDLKPANVILHHDLHAVVVDFGMAKIVTGGIAGTTQLTQHNMIFGTPEYMAPEQGRGDELDERCDIYATGILLYELLTGSVPFTAPSPIAVLTAHMTEPVVPPRQRAPARGISPALEAVVMHAVQKERGRRYPTAVALAAALRHAVARPDDVTSVEPWRFDDNPAVPSTPSAGVDPHGPTELDLPPSAPNSAKPPSIQKVRYRRDRLTTAKNLAIWAAAALIGIWVGVWLATRFG